MYDAVYLYALAVNACLADGWPPENSSHVMKYLTNREFQGTQQQYYLKQKKSNNCTKVRWSDRIILSSAWMNSMTSTKVIHLEESETYLGRSLEFLLFNFTLIVWLSQFLPCLNLVPITLENALHELRYFLKCISSFQHSPWIILTLCDVCLCVLCRKYQLVFLWELQCFS